MSTTTTKAPSVIEEQLYLESQSWNFTQIVATANGRFRVRIRRNAHDFQSYAIVERWDGERWNEVATRPITACACATVSYVHKTVDRALFAADASDLLQVALQVVCGR